MSDPVQRPPSPPAPGRSPAGRRITWGLGDVVLAWVCGFAAVAVVVAAFPGLGDDPISLLVQLLAQALPLLVYLAWAARVKGMGSLRADFGLVARVADLKWVLVGVGLQVAGSIVTAPLRELYGSGETQEVVRLARRAGGVEIPLVALAVVLVAPVAEELLFRGAMLRSLLRRTTPAWAAIVSAGVFAVLHLGDASIGTVMAMPAILGLGLVSAHQAIKTGDLSRSIMLHVGFNLLSAVLLFAGY